MERKTKKYRPKPIPKHERKRKKRASPKTTTALATRQAPPVSEAIEKVLIGGDLNPLSPEQRIDYMKAVCKSLGLNPLTQPFSYILFKETENAPAKLVLYARKDCAEQLRKIHGVSVIPGMTKRTMDDDFATVEVSVRDQWGKTDTATGMVYLWKKYDGKLYRLTGQRLADAILKAETKAKRRATLSVCGLGILDEHDLGSLRVVGGVTPEGRTFEYRQLPPQSSPEEPQGIDDLRARGLWCDEHNCTRSANHLKTCESSRKAMEAHKPAPQNAPEPQTKAPKASEPSAPSAPATADMGAIAPQITLDWSVDEASPRLIGDSEVIERLKPDIHASWGKDEFWHIEARDAETIRRLQGEYSYKLLEVLPKADSSSGAKAPGGTTPSPGGDAHGKRSGSSGGSSGSSGQPAPAVEWLTGTVEQFSEKMTKGTKGDEKKNIKPRPAVPYLSVLIKSAEGKSQWYSLFDKELFRYINRGKVQKQGTFIVKRQGEFANIVGFKRIENIEFDESGKVEEIQQSTREAGGKTLF